MSFLKAIDLTGQVQYQGLQPANGLFSNMWVGSLMEGWRPGGLLHLGKLALREGEDDKDTIAEAISPMCIIPPNTKSANDNFRKKTIPNMKKRLYDKIERLFRVRADESGIKGALVTSPTDGNRSKYDVEGVHKGIEYIINGSRWFGITRKTWFDDMLDEVQRLVSEYQIKGSDLTERAIGIGFAGEMGEYLHPRRNIKIDNFEFHLVQTRAEARTWWLRTVAKYQWLMAIALKTFWDACVDLYMQFADDDEKAKMNSVIGLDPCKHDIDWVAFASYLMGAWGGWDKDIDNERIYVVEEGLVSLIYQFLCSLESKAYPDMGLPRKLSYTDQEMSVIEQFLSTRTTFGVIFAMCSYRIGGHLRPLEINYSGRSTILTNRIRFRKRWTRMPFIIGGSNNPFLLPIDLISLGVGYYVPNVVRASGKVEWHENVVKDRKVDDVNIMRGEAPIGMPETDRNLRIITSRDTLLKVCRYKDRPQYYLVWQGNLIDYTPEHPQSHIMALISDGTLAPDRAIEVSCKVLKPELVPHRGWIQITEVDDAEGIVEDTIDEETIPGTPAAGPSEEEQPHVMGGADAADNAEKRKDEKGKRDVDEEETGTPPPDGAPASDDAEA